MPSLGFLKKKRTKDSSGPQDVNSPASPVGNSPVTSTSAVGSKEIFRPTVSRTSTGLTQSTAGEKANSSGEQLTQVLSQQQPPTAALQNAQLNSPAPPTTENFHDPPRNDGAASSEMADQNNRSMQIAPKCSAAPAVPRVTKGKYHLADFNIQRTLGTGSFGRVHLVQSKHNQRFYAIKVLKKQQVVRMKQVEHTNDERRMLGLVKHAFLITLWGTFQDSKNLYMVMDFVEGGELFSLLRKSQVGDISYFVHYHAYYSYFEHSSSRRTQRFPNPVAKFYAAEVTLALEYLHSMNIIYRDLKPENLLLDRHGHLKITDFGFAKEVPDQTWTLCGTPDYLAPEVVASKGYTKAVDWYVTSTCEFFAYN